MNTNELATRNDLNWLATCYVAGELSAAEAAAFEERLATDEAACSAVARALDLCVHLAAALETHSDVQPLVPVLKPSTINLQPATPTRFASLSLTALAATAVAAAGIALMVQPTDPNGNKVAKKDRTARIVAHWVRGEAFRNDLDDDADAIDSEDSDDLDPPDWMLAALMAEEQKLPGSSGDDSKLLEKKDL